MTFNQVYNFKSVMTLFPFVAVMGQMILGGAAFVADSF
jgi:hypothetical protein